EIHEQKGEIVENVDRGDVVVELDAVENHRLAADQRHIAQMQIAMAEAHPALRAALVEQIAVAGEKRGTRSMQHPQMRGIENLAREGGGIGVVARKSAREAFRAALVRQRRGMAVKVRDARRQRLDMRAREAALAGHAGEKP